MLFSCSLIKLHKTITFFFRVQFLDFWGNFYIPNLIILFTSLLCILYRIVTCYMVDRRCREMVLDIEMRRIFVILFTKTSLSFYLTQVVTGCGCFKHYLRRIQFGKKLQKQSNSTLFSYGNIFIVRKPLNFFQNKFVTIVAF